MPKTGKIEVNPNATYNMGRIGRSRVVPTNIADHKHSTVTEETKLKALRYADEYVDTLAWAADSQLDFALRFYKLSALWVDILVFLHRRNGVYCGNYSDLTVALGRNAGPNGHVTNIRKCCIELASRNILFIDFAENGRPIMFRLNGDWTAKI